MRNVAFVKDTVYNDCIEAESLRDLCFCLINKLLYSIIYLYRLNNIEGAQMQSEITYYFNRNISGYNSTHDITVIMKRYRLLQLTEKGAANVLGYLVSAPACLRQNAQLATEHLSEL